MKIGVDMTFIPRFANKEKLAEKVLCEEEFIEYNQANNKAQYLASRFALKEAFIKSFEMSILSINLNEIKCLKKENGAIYIYHNKNKYECSLSHENEYCIGVVLHD